MNLELNKTLVSTLSALVSTLSAAVVVFLAGGASCVPRNVRPNAPVVFLANPSIQDVMRVVNDNSAKVFQLEMTDAAISIPSIPNLSADLAWQRPRNFRLRASLLARTEVDMGSNEELFWLFVPRDQPPTVYFARHDQFSSSAARAILPVSADWVIDALGLMTFDPNGQHSGPERRPDGRLRVRSRVTIGNEPMNRIAVIDAAHGWVLEQHLIDDRGQPIASAVASDYRYYPDPGVNLPHHVQVNLPPAGMNIAVRVGAYVLNAMLPGSENRWTMPRPTGATFVDLANRTPIVAPNSTRNGPFESPSFRSADRRWINRVRGFSRIEPR